MESAHASKLQAAVLEPADEESKSLITPKPGPKDLDSDFSNEERMMFLGKMVSAVSHELNNRLSSVLGFAELLALKECPPDTKRLVNKLKTYTESLRILAEGLSGFSKTRASTASLCDPTPFVKQAVDLAGCEAKAMGVRIMLQLKDSLPRVNMVSSKFRLGLFIILDAFVCDLAETGEELSSNGRIEMFCEPGRDGRGVIEMKVMRGTHPHWQSSEPPAYEGLIQARAILEAQNVSCTWKPISGGGWLYRLEIPGQ